VKGEVEGSTESTGHGGVLSRSGASSCVSWRAWAFPGRVWARQSWSALVLVRSREGMVMLIKVRASSMTCCGSAEVKGDCDGMVGDKRAGMV
jgi:hypothetical protein